MRTIFIFSFVCALLFSTLNCYSQSGYEMKEGEIITVDKNGKILKTNMPTPETSKYNSEIIEKTTVEKNTIYFEDGSLKIPGYIYSGVKEVDEQSYKKAKYKLYNENPTEYEKWFGKKTKSAQVKVTMEEFSKMPDIKKQQILAHPEKYYFENPNEIKDCNN